MNNRKISAFIPASSGLFLKLVVAFAITSVFLAMSLGPDYGGVKGVKDERDSYMRAINDEIEKTIRVIEARPDYAEAWLRLSVLYEQIGESELSRSAMETAKNLNPDL